MPASIPFPRAIVDCAAFRGNLKAVRADVGPNVRIMAVIKANGYGHGMIPLAREAAASGIGDFGIARVHEGIELRDAGFHQRILVFEAAQAADVRRAVEAELTLTAMTPQLFEEIESAAQACGKKAAVHVKCDTGMGRLGLPPDQAIALMKRIARSRWTSLEGVYSHFATSELPDRTFAEEQLQRFLEVVEAVRKAGVDVPLRHMANSGAIIAMPCSSGHGAARHHALRLPPAQGNAGTPPCPARSLARVPRRICEDCRCRNLHFVRQEVLYGSPYHHRHGASGLRRRVLKAAYREV